MSGGAGPLVPTFHGFVQNSMDGLVLFEACLSNKLHHVPRRPHDRERTALIKSGSIFIYEENASGIKRWTDGVAWSPSRILGNFLIYRELEKPFPPGEKKKANKRKRTSVAGEPYPRRDSADTNHTSHSHLPTPLTPPIQEGSSDVKSEGAAGIDQEKELERSLIGSLVDSYGFRPDGLVKKTMSINYNGVMHHMVSYYKVEDVKNNLLPRPATDPRLANIQPRAELFMKQNFRAPVEELDPYSMEGQMHPHAQMMYSPMPGAQYAVRAQHAYYQTPSYHQMYSLPPSTSTTVYGALTAPSWSTQQSPTTTSGHAGTWSAQPSSAGASSTWTGQQSATPSATSTQPSWAPQHSPNPAAAAGASSSWSAPHASPNPASGAQSSWASTQASPNPAGAAQSSWAAPQQASPNTTHTTASWPTQQTSPNPNTNAATAQWTAQQASGGGAGTAWSWPTQQPATGASTAQWAQQSPRTVDTSSASGSAPSWQRPTQPAAGASNAWSTPTAAGGGTQWQNTNRAARAYP